MSASDLTRQELVMAGPAATEQVPDQDGRGATRLSLDAWFGIASAVVIMSAVARLLEEGVFTPWMLAAHLNLGLLMLTKRSTTASGTCRVMGRCADPAGPRTCWRASVVMSSSS